MVVEPSPHPDCSQAVLRQKAGRECGTERSSEELSAVESEGACVRADTALADAGDGGKGKQMGGYRPCRVPGDSWQAAKKTAE